MSTLSNQWQKEVEEKVKAKKKKSTKKTVKTDES